MPRLRYGAAIRTGSVTRMRAPLAPMVWPEGRRPPPFTFIFFGIELEAGALPRWQRRRKLRSVDKTDAPSCRRSNGFGRAIFQRGSTGAHHQPTWCVDAADGLPHDSRNRRFSTRAGQRAFRSLVTIKAGRRRRWLLGPLANAR